MPHTFSKPDPCVSLCAAVVGLFLLSFITMYLGYGIFYVFGMTTLVFALPLLYLVFAAGLVAATVIAANVLLPNVTVGQKFKLWSPEFARWWCVCRMIDITNTFVMRYFRGTILMNHWCNLLVSSCLTFPCDQERCDSDAAHMSVGDAGHRQSSKHLLQSFLPCIRSTRGCHHAELKPKQSLFLQLPFAVSMQCLKPAQQPHTE